MKYGMKFREWNVCRWLLFSNHLQAIPLDEGDRRIEVVVNENKPKHEDYYTALYAALNDEGFINGIASFLKNRDISNFNPGRRAQMNTAKEMVIHATKSDIDLKVEELIETWPSDVIRNNEICFELGGDSKKGVDASMRNALTRHGCTPTGPISTREGKARGWFLRNYPHWKSQAQSLSAAEMLKGVKQFGQLTCPD